MSSPYMSTSEDVVSCSDAPKRLGRVRCGYGALAETASKVSRGAFIVASWARKNGLAPREQDIGNNDVPINIIHLAYSYNVLYDSFAPSRPHYSGRSRSLLASACAPGPGAGALGGLGVITATLQHNHVNIETQRQRK